MAAAFVDLKEQERASKNAREKELENENARLRKIRAINDKNVSKKIIRRISYVKLVLYVNFIISQISLFKILQFINFWQVSVVLKII